MVFSKRVVTLLFIVFIIGTADNAKALQYSSFIFSTYDIVFFSYEDGTVLEIYEKDGSTVFDWRDKPVIINGGDPLNKGEHIRLIYPYDLTKYGKTYLVTGSKKFSVLIGDPTYGQNGYYAMDQNGKGASTEFYTYVPQRKGAYGTQKFIVFAYQDGTELTVEYADPNWVYHEVVTDFPLDKGENWSSEDLSEQYVHITANKPVSALSCYDTGYFVPSANGSFSGTKFYTYIGKNWDYEQYLPQDLVIISYDNNTLVTIADCNDVVTWLGTLNAGEVQVERFPDGLDEPVSVTSTRPVTVSVQQWVTNNEYSEYDDLFHGFFVPGRDGTGLGGFSRDILIPTHQAGYLIIMVYTDNTHVKLYNAETGVLVKTYKRNKGQYVFDYPSNGLWRIVSDKPVSAHTGIRSTQGFLSNAEFAPLLFDVTTGDMVKVDTGASFAGDCIQPNDPNYNEISYTIAYWSDPNDDTDVVITDYLPREVEFISADPCDNGFYDPNFHTYTWDIGSVTGQEPNCYCHLTVRVNGYAQPGQNIINKVQLTSHTSYSTAEVSTPVCCPPDPVIYVKADADGFRNGSSWADAYTTLQPALTRARAGFGSEIWVAGGVYHPSKYITRTLLRLLDGVQIYGGFGGDETSRDQRDFVANKTYLSGDIDAEGDNDSFGVVFSGWDIEPDSVLDGFVITAGDPCGGMYCDWSWPTIRNCVFTKNREHGIICDYASPRIYDCRIEENVGSGIYSGALNHVFAGRPIVKRCVVQNNYIGIECRDDGRPVITNSWIYNNTREGILLRDTQESVVIRDNTIVGNGIYGIKSNLPVDLSNCIFWGNSTQLSANCNAIYSCIQGGAAGEGNISDNPDFAYDDPDNYHLGPDSPCIDAGHDPNGDGTYYDILDIDRNVRVYNGRVDMGADEYTCDEIYNYVDWDADAIVDTNDLIILVDAWLSDPCTDNWNPVCDIQPQTGDGDVDYGDFAVFATEWLWEPCWTTSGPSAPMMMGMGGGGGESMPALSGVEGLLAETSMIETAQASEIPTEPTVEEQTEQIKKLLDWLDEIKDEIDEATRLNLAGSLEEMLKELEDSRQG